MPVFLMVQLFAQWHRKEISLARILIIDDDPMVLELLQGVLSSAGHEVTAAANGLDGMKQFRAGFHELVITDVCMPYIDGADLLRVLRRETPDVPVIVVTGHSSIEKGASMQSTLELMSRLGAVHVLAKPFLPEALLESVAASLGR